MYCIVTEEECYIYVTLQAFSILQFNLQVYKGVYIYSGQSGKKPGYYATQRASLHHLHNVEGSQLQDVMRTGQ